MLPHFDIFPYPTVIIASKWMEKRTHQNLKFTLTSYHALSCNVGYVDLNLNTRQQKHHILQYIHSPYYSHCILTFNTSKFALTSTWRKAKLKSSFL